jgi:hypothetical protein
VKLNRRTQKLALIRFIKIANIFVGRKIRGRGVGVMATSIGVDSSMQLTLERGIEMGLPEQKSCKV